MSRGLGKNQRILLEALQKADAGVRVPDLAKTLNVDYNNLRRAAHKLVGRELAAVDKCSVHTGLIVWEAEKYEVLVEAQTRAAQERERQWREAQERKRELYIENRRVQFMEARADCEAEIRWFLSDRTTAVRRGYEGEKSNGYRSNCSHKEFAEFREWVNSELEGQRWTAAVDALYEGRLAEADDLTKSATDTRECTKGIKTLIPSADLVSRIVMERLFQDMPEPLRDIWARQRRPFTERPCGTRSRDSFDWDAYKDDNPEWDRMLASF